MDDRVLWAIRDDRTLSQRAKLAYIMLWSRGAKAHPSMKRLAADMGSKSATTARAAVAELQRAGFVKVQPRVTALGDPDTNQYDVVPVLLPERGTTDFYPTVVSESVPEVPKPEASKRTGDQSRASRHARPAISREQAIRCVLDAVVTNYGQAEADDLTDGQCVALWLLLVGERRPAKPVPYLCKIFDETPYLDTHLASAGTEEDWT